MISNCPGVVFRPPDRYRFTPTAVHRKNFYFLQVLCGKRSPVPIRIPPPRLGQSWRDIRCSPDVMADGIHKSFIHKSFIRKSFVAGIMSKTHKARSKQTHAITEALEPRQLLSTVPTPAHVVVVMEENSSFDEIIGNSQAPYINSLASQGALFSQSFAVTHPSQPNYLAIFSGSTQGVTDDNGPISFNSANLRSTLAAVGQTFAGYSEDLPSTGSTVLTSGD